MRIYEVTLTRTMTCTIAAENEVELEAALEDAQYDFDDWNPPDWAWTVFDPLKALKKPEDLDRLPKVQKKPDMGVDDRGEILAFSDLDEAAVMEEIEATVREVKLKVGMSDRQGMLPGIK